MGDLLSAASLLLTVVSVVYGVWYPEITGALDAKIPAYAEDRKKPLREITEILFRRSLPLAVAACTLVALFLPEAIAITCSSATLYRMRGLAALHMYDAVATSFVVVVVFSAAIAAHTVRLASKVFAKRAAIAA